MASAIHDISKSIKFHKKHGKLATITAVNPSKQYGVLELDESNLVSRFREKPKDGNWINGGFFVLSPYIFEYIEDNKTIWEQESLQRLTSDQQLLAFKHTGFWHSVDTQRFDTSE